MTPSSPLPSPPPSPHPLAPPLAPPLNLTVGPENRYPPQSPLPISSLELESTRAYLSSNTTGPPIDLTSPDKSENSEAGSETSESPQERMDRIYGNLQYTTDSEADDSEADDSDDEKNSTLPPQKKQRYIDNYHARSTKRKRRQRDNIPKTRPTFFRSSGIQTKEQREGTEPDNIPKTRPTFFRSRGIQTKEQRERTEEEDAVSVVDIQSEHEDSRPLRKRSGVGVFRGRGQKRGRGGRGKRGRSGRGGSRRGCSGRGGSRRGRSGHGGSRRGRSGRGGSGHGRSGHAWSGDRSGQKGSSTTTTATTTTATTTTATTTRFPTPTAQ